MVVADAVYSAVANKCPRCHTGYVFVANNPYNFKKGLTMKERCSHCGLKYETEPGFFYGAMYVSYALTVGYSVLSWLVWWAITGDITLGLMWFIIVSLLVLMPVTFRWSRILWMNFFVRYKPEYKKHLPSDKTF